MLLQKVVKKADNSVGSFSHITGFINQVVNLMWNAFTADPKHCTFSGSFEIHWAWDYGGSGLAVQSRMSSTHCTCCTGTCVYSEISYLCTCTCCCLSDFSSSDKFIDRIIAALLFWQVAHRSVIGLQTTTSAKKFLHTLQKVVYATERRRSVLALSW